MVDRSDGSVLRRTAAAFAFALAALARAAGAAPPSLVVRDLAGGDVTLAPPDGGRALVAHFFATWCADCAVELPALARAAEGCEGSGVHVVLVDVDEDPAKVSSFLGGLGVSLPVRLDPGGRVWRAIGLGGLPANLVLEGERRRLVVGPAGEAAWRERLAALGCRTGGDVR